MIPAFASRSAIETVLARFEHLYGEEARKCLDRFVMLLGRYGVNGDPVRHKPETWSEKSVYLITYGDMVTAPGERPLQTLHRFANQYLKDAVDTIHILPFFPYSSDDGFSVIDYREVNSELGTWKDIKDIDKDFDLMFDLVLNHASRHSRWFKGFIAEVAPPREYFIEVDPGTDLSSVVRPRSSPLLTAVQTRNRERWIWTTFSEDQCDLNFANPNLLFEFLDILLFYISMGAHAVRLDAIAYLWKRIGTECIHLPETHEVVKLFRNLLDVVAPQVILLTETNVPHKENISYFGDGDEAHMVYQFSLPPLLLHALLTGNSQHLTNWAAALGNAPEGCTFLNFTASHDGIGVRPLQGLISDKEMADLVADIQAKGGYVSKKMNSDGSESPYELNITYYDALGGTADESDDMKISRFLCSQTVAMALQGVPAIYFNSLVAASNNTGGVELTGHARTINRGKWNLDDLEELINNPESEASRAFSAYLDLLHVRTDHPAFHPNAPQRILDIGDSLFCIERTAVDGSEVVVSISNFTCKPLLLKVDDRFPALAGEHPWLDLIRRETRGEQDGQLELAPYETCWLQVSSDE
ncbi:MAG: sugar phosphorylase [Verrucomicrobia bacterium]|nr:sugar phosphorylase [Verrucomicrobiota bacterium]